MRAFARAGSDFQTASDYQPGFNQTFQAASYLIALYHTTNPQHLSPRYKPNGRPQHHCHKSRAAISESFAVPRSGSVPLTSVFAFILLFSNSVSLFPFPFPFPFLFLSFFLFPYILYYPEGNPLRQKMVGFVRFFYPSALFLRICSSLFFVWVAV